MWLSIFAYMIRFGAKLGLVKTQPATATDRAYLRAHQGVHWLREQLTGCTVSLVEEHRVRYYKNGEPGEIVFRDGRLMTPSPGGEVLSDVFFYDPRGSSTFEVGPGGYVGFEYQGQSLTVTLEATDDSLGEVGRHRTRISFTAPRAP